MLKAALSASQYKCNPYHKLFRFAQPAQERQELGILRSVTALPRLFISYTCAVFSHSSQTSSITRTLNQHICMFSGILLLERIFFYHLKVNEDGIQITASDIFTAIVSTLVAELALMQTEFLILKTSSIHCRLVS